jgi:transcriptional regulator of acetoin/glycerol metabolism
VQLPALRERGDTADLIDDMMRSLALDMKRDTVPTVTEEVVDALLQHPWPGNLRQLHAVLRTACALMGPHDTELHWEHFSEDLWYDVFSRPYRDGLSPQTSSPPMAQRLDTQATSPDDDAGETNLRRLSSSAIERAIQTSGGNMSEAARRLGISRNTLYRRLKQTAS